MIRLLGSVHVEREGCRWNHRFVVRVGIAFVVGVNVEREGCPNRGVYEFQIRLNRGQRSSPNVLGQCDIISLSVI